MPTGSELGRRVEILLVEDSQTDAELLKAAMEDVALPHNLSRVENGEEALAYLRNEGDFASAACPDLLFVDLKMPRMGGLELLRRLREDSRLKRIPAIVLSTSEHEQDIADAYDLGARAYLRKKMDISDFAATMQSLAAFWLSQVILPPRDL